MFTALQSLIVYLRAFVKNTFFQVGKSRITGINSSHYSSIFLDQLHHFLIIHLRIWFLIGSRKVKTFLELFLKNKNYILPILFYQTYNIASNLCSKIPVSFISWTFVSWSFSNIWIGGFMKELFILQPFGIILRTSSLATFLEIFLGNYPNIVFK